MKNVGLVHTYEADGSVVTDVAVQVQNTGDVPLVMSNPSVRIGDADGTVIVDKSDDSIFTGPTYLRVGDVGFIYTNSPIHLPEGYAVSQDYLAQATADLTACKEVYEYPLSNLQIADNGQERPVITGTVTNDSAEEAKFVEITAAFFDNENHLLGVAGTLVLELGPNESQGFTIDGNTLPIACTMAVISDYDVIAVAPKY